MRILAQSNKIFWLILLFVRITYDSNIPLVRRLAIWFCIWNGIVYSQLIWKKIVQRGHTNKRTHDHAQMHQKNYSIEKKKKNQIRYYTFRILVSYIMIFLILKYWKITPYVNLVVLHGFDINHLNEKIKMKRRKERNSCWVPILVIYY